MLATNREEYDVIVSLGGSCSAASQLKHRGRRPYSLPLDWALMRDERPIRNLPGLFRTKFADFCLPGNMEEFEAPGDEYGVRKYHLLDNLTGYQMIHHFTARPADRRRFEEQRGGLLRRVDRLYGRMASARSALFVLNTAFTYDPELLVPVRDALTEVFPGTDIDVVAMQFSAEGNRTAELAGGKIKVDFIQRHLDIVYDNQFTAPEWRWMDQIRITGVPEPKELRKSRLLVKWTYKLWWTLGKYLERKGAGCTCVRFMRFKRYS